jgi:hypothetical protein
MCKEKDAHRLLRTAWDSAADGLAADREALDLPELLGAVAVIEVAVRGLDQLHDAAPDLDIQCPGRGPAPQTMDQRPDARGPIPGLEAPELPRVMSRAWAPAPVEICPATASCTRPDRRASLRLIVRISHVSMGGHFYSAARRT